MVSDESELSDSKACLYSNEKETVLTAHSSRLCLSLTAREKVKISGKWNFQMLPPPHPRTKAVS